MFLLYSVSLIVAEAINCVKWGLILYVINQDAEWKTVRPSKCSVDKVEPIFANICEKWLLILLFDNFFVVSMCKFSKKKCWKNDIKHLSSLLKIILLLVLLLIIFFNFMKLLMLKNILWS